MTQHSNDKGKVEDCVYSGVTCAVCGRLAPAEAQKRAHLVRMKFSQQTKLEVKLCK